MILLAFLTILTWKSVYVKINTMKNRPDLTGQTFGRLTVVRYNGVSKKGLRTWECKCICGSIRILTTNALNSGNSSSCGCAQREFVKKLGKNNLKELAGRRFGNLLVVERTETPSTTIATNSFWKCLCDCGKYTVVNSANLGRNINSCGCNKVKQTVETKSRNNLFKNNDPYLNVRYHHCLTTSRNRKIKFSLTKQQVYDIITQPCFYCSKFEIEESIKNEFKALRMGMTDFLIKPTNGIDRIDSSEGYVENNVRSCCTKCNQAKMDLKEEDFYNLVQRQYKSLVKRGLIKED